MPNPLGRAAAEGMPGSMHEIPRHRIEAAIEALIDLLDASEPDADDEPYLAGFAGADDGEDDGSDDEPWLGWFRAFDGGDGGPMGGVDDCEEDCDPEPDTDLEADGPAGHMDDRERVFGEPPV